MPETPIDVSLHELLHQREWLARLAGALVRDPHAADDAAQQTWLQALRQRTPVREGRAFLSAVLGNVVRQQHRSDARRERREHEVATQRASAADLAAEANERFETHRLVAAAVQALDEPFRSTVLLHHFEGMSLAAIGKSQQVPDGTVRWRLFRAHQLLREALEARLGRDEWRRALAVLCVPMRRSALLTPAASLLLACGVLATAVVWIAASLTSDPPPRATEVVAATSGDATSERAAHAPAVRDPVADRESVPAASSQEPAPGDIRVTVRARIAGADGEPLAGASLRLARARLGSMETQGRTLAPFAAPAHAGPDGEVVLALRAPGALLALLPRQQSGELVGTLVFTAAADDHAPREVEAHLANGDDKRLGTIALHEVATIRGRVLDTEGRSVPDARVCVLRPPFGVLPPEDVPMNAEPAGTVDAATGAFELAAVRTGLVMVHASKPGFFSASTVLDVEAPAARCSDLVLRGGAPPAVTPGRPMPPMHVLVVDGRGEPVAGADVQYRVTFAGGSVSAGHATTSDTGRVSLATFGEWRVLRLDLAVTGGERALGGVALPDVPLAEGEVRVELVPAAPLEVRARGADGKPLPRFTVSWNAKAPALGNGFATGANGIAALASPFVPTALVLRASGHGVASVPFTPGQTTSPIDVTLESESASGGITGIVTAGGKPVAGATVSLLQCDAPVLQNGYLAEATRAGGANTGPDGRFRIEHQRAGPVRLRVRADGHATTLTARRDHDPARAAQDVVIELGAGGAIEGTVRHRDGTPVPRALVAVNAFDGDTKTVFADRQGRFFCEHLRAGGYEVRIGDRPMASSWSTEGIVAPDRTAPQADCEVQDGATTKFELVVDRCRATGTLAATGFDPRHWSARLQRAHDGQRTCEDVVLRSDGAFVLSSSSEGPHELRFTAPGGPLGNVTVLVKVTLVTGDSPVIVPVALAPFRGKAGAAAQGAWLEQSTPAQRVTASVPVDPVTLDFQAPLAPVGDVVLVESSGATTREVGRFVVAPR